jgi:hypothetical protein
MAGKYSGPERRATVRGAHDRIDGMSAAMDRLEALVEHQSIITTQGVLSGTQHIEKCDGRDILTTERFKNIAANLMRQDKLLYWMLGGIGSVLLAFFVEFMHFLLK